MAGWDISSATNPSGTSGGLTQMMQTPSLIYQMAEKNRKLLQSGAAAGFSAGTQETSKKNWVVIGLAAAVVLAVVWGARRG